MKLLVSIKGITPLSALAFLSDNGEAYATFESMEGVVVWLPPGGFPIPPVRQLLSARLLPMHYFLFHGGGALKSIGDYFDKRHLELIPRPHWYLEILGVDPVHQGQGQGHGGRLVRAMFERADAQSVPIYVETMGEQAAAIYRHLGFDILEESTIPNLNLPYSCLAREPA